MAKKKKEKPQKQDENIEPAIAPEKVTEGNELNDRKKRVLPFLLSCKTFAEAARCADLNPKQIFEYLKDPAFRAELDLQRNNVVYEAIGKIKAHTTKAADVLAALMDSESEQIRRGAANDILTHVLKYMELREIEERLTNIEKQLKSR